MAMAASTNRIDGETAHDEVKHLAAWHDGDLRAAIRTLLEDRRHLRAQLALATSAMSYGYTRGWLPCEERGDTAAGD